MLRLKHGGWSFSQPPNVQFELNTELPVAKNLVAWWTTLADGGNLLRNMAHPGVSDFDTFTGPPERVSHYQLGRPLDFDGSNDYVSGPYSNLLNINYPFTLTVRGQRLNGGASWHQYLFFASETSNDGYTILFNKGNDISVVVRRAGVYDHQLFFDNRSAILDPFHLVVVFESSTVAKVYLNEALLSEDAGSPSASFNPDKLFLGSDRFGNNKFYGHIAEVCKFNCALSVDQIHHFYKNPWAIYRPRLPHIWGMSPSVPGAYISPYYYESLLAGAN